MKVLLAIPCYNCAVQLPRVLAEFDERLVSRLERVILIDNRSTDATLQVARAEAKTFIQRFAPRARIQVFQNVQNYGLGGTHKVALQIAEAEGFDYLAILHGDNQASTQELHGLLDQATARPELDAVLGARFMRGSRLQGYSLWRRLGNRALNWFYTFASGRRTYDLGSGLNLFKLQTLRDHRYLAFSDAFTFNMDLLLDYFSKKSKLLYVPITWRECDQISNAKMFRVGWVTVLTLLKWRMGRLASPSKIRYLSQLVS